MVNGMKLIGLGILCVTIAVYLNTSGIVSNQYEVYLVFAGIILGGAGFFMKDNKDTLNEEENNEEENAESNE